LIFLCVILGAGATALYGELLTGRNSVIFIQCMSLRCEQAFANAMVTVTNTVVQRQSLQWLISHGQSFMTVLIR